MDVVCGCTYGCECELTLCAHLSAVCFGVTSIVCQFGRVACYTQQNTCKYFEIVILIVTAAIAFGEYHRGQCVIIHNIIDKM